MTQFKQDDRDGLRPDTAPERCVFGMPSPGAGESSISIDESAVAEFIAFFGLLDKWDQEAQCHEKMR